MWKRILRKFHKKKKKISTTNQDILSEIISQMDDQMVNNLVFKNSNLTVAVMATIIGTNRTYVSRALNNRKILFRDYVNLYRLNFVLSIICRMKLKNDGKVVDDEEIAIMAGYAGRRTMNNNCLRLLEKPFSEIRHMDIELIKKMSMFALQKYNYGRRENNFFNEWCGENYSSQ